MITNTNRGDAPSVRFDIQDLKHQMSGRWDIFLSHYGLVSPITDGRNHACPKCGGEDRFNVDRQYATTGTVWCRQCHPKGGDGFETYRWLTGQTNRNAFQAVAEFCGVSFSSASRPAASVDVVALVASAKKVSTDALVAYGAVRVGTQQKVKVPVYSLVDGQAVVTSRFTFGCIDKGLHQRGTHNPGLFLPEGRRPQPGETWCVVEGVKDAAALYSLGFDTAGLPTSTLPVYHVEFFRGVDVIVVPDLDMAGQRGAQKTGGVLHGIASSVRVAKLPGEVVESKGQDVRDILQRADGASLVRDAIANAGTWVPRDDDDQRGDDDPRPEITIDPHGEADVNSRVVDALGQLGWSITCDASQRERIRVYQRVGRLVEVMTTTTHRTIKSGNVEVPEGTVSVREIPASILRERIGQAVRLVRYKAMPSGDIALQPTTPTRSMVDVVLERGHYPGVRVLRGVVTVPTLRMDGSVLQVPGYDDVTQLVYQPNDQYPVLGDTATRNQAVEDIELIRSIVSDFCFESDADFSAWFAMVLTMTCRHLVDGCVPLFAVTANVRGAGKSLLADVANIIAYGRPSARKVYTDDDNEMRKAITSVLLEGIPSVLLDNIDRSFGGASLDAVLTSRTYSDRVLGANRTTGDLPADTIWTLTGNNVSYVGDMVRRVLPVRLMSQHERPEDRTDFAQRDLLSHVTAIRAGLVVRVVRVMQAYLLAGRPVQPGGQWGGFSQWYDLVRGCVMWCGLDDPMTTRVTALESDSSTDAVALLHEAIHEAMNNGQTYGVTASKLVLMADEATSDGAPRYPAIYEAVAMLCGSRPNSKSLGRQIGLYKNRWLGERQIVIEKDSHTKTNLIRLRGADMTSVVESEPF